MEMLYLRSWTMLDRNALLKVRGMLDRNALLKVMDDARS